MKAKAKIDYGKTVIDDVIMVFLSLVSICLLFFEVFSSHTTQQSLALEAADVSIASVFLIEFCIRFLRTDDRKKFLRCHWWELLAAIPISSNTAQALRSLNLLRIFRLIRLLRLIRFVARFKILLSYADDFLQHTYLIYLSTIAGLIIMSGALGFHYMEAGVNPNVHSLWDSFWWTVVTITTVGYGDIYPVTTGGRILAIFLMLGGIATVSTITAFIAAYIVRSDTSLVRKTEPEEDVSDSSQEAGDIIILPPATDE